MNLRWGIDGPTVEFKGGRSCYSDTIFAAPVDANKYGDHREIAVEPCVLGGYRAKISFGYKNTIKAYGGCQQTALDRLHARLREVAAEITAAL